MTTLLDLLTEDGVALRGSGAQRTGLCPFHEEKTPSFSVNVEEGVFHCFTCDARGNAYTYLTEKRGMAPADAHDILRDQVTAPPPKPKRKPKVYPALPKRRLAEHIYTDADGAPVLIVCRYEPLPATASDEERGRWRKCDQWTPAEGGYAPAGLGDRKSPLYRLPVILETPMDRQVMVVEGEKCVEVVEQAFGGKAVATTWAGGSNAKLERVDWTPLYGRRVLLVSDEDATGRKAMTALGELLAPHCASVRSVLAPGETGDDIEQWLAAGGLEGAAAKIREHVRDVPKPETAEPVAETDNGKGAEPPPPVATNGILDNPHFRVLGWVRDHIAVMLLATYQLRPFTPASLGQPMNLVTLADYHWWLTVTGRDTLSAATCQQVGSVLIREANDRGIIDPAQILGRGACRLPAGGVGWHLGDRLLVDGQEQGLGDIPGITPVVGPAISISETAATEADRRRVAKAILGYRWLHPNDGRRFMGWLICAVLGGALDWRPHVWMSAPSGTGKSWLLKTVMRPLLGPLLLTGSDVTVAGLARWVGSDAIGVAIDEAEATKPQMEALLDLARVATGGDGARIRADGGSATAASVMQPRFSLLLSSVTVSRMNAANASRFAIVRLATAGVPNWETTRDDIKGALASPERFLAAIVRDAPEIIEKVRQMEDLLVGSGQDTRRAAIEAALGAGWWWWSGEEEFVLEDAEQEESSAESADMLRYLMGLRIREKGDDMSIGRILQAGDAERNARDYGFKLDGDVLCIGARHPSLIGLIARGAWAGVDIQRTLMQIEGTSKTASTLRFGAVKTRAIQIPREVCERLEIDVFARDDMLDPTRLD